MLFNEQLISAVKRGNAEEVGFLLDRGADVNTKSDSGDTPLHLAATNRHSNIVRLLLKYGADVESRNNKRDTPIICATKYSFSTIVKLLLMYGADVNVDTESCTFTVDYAVDCIKSGVVYEEYEIFFLLILFNNEFEPMNFKDRIEDNWDRGRDESEDESEDEDGYQEAFKYLRIFDKIIKKMPCFSEIIEVNRSRDVERNAQVISGYMEDETKRQKLIKEFQDIREDANSSELDANLVLSCLFFIVENMVQDWKKIKAASAFLSEIKIKGAIDISNSLVPFLNCNDVLNIALLNKNTYKILKPLNEMLREFEWAIFPDRRPQMKRQLDEDEAGPSSKKGKYEN